MKKVTSSPGSKCGVDAEENMSNCPVCFKNFTRSQIESHVNTCLFLSCESNEQECKHSDGQKRQLMKENNSPSNSKKFKEDNIPVTAEYNYPRPSTFTSISKVSD